MKPSPTHIHYRVQWQVLGPESPGQRFERRKFEEFFHRLNADPKFSGYDDFTYRPDRCELSQVREPSPSGGQAFSKVVYAKDSLSVVEEWTDLGSEEFAQKIKVVLDNWFACFPQTLAVAQHTCIRALVSLIHFTDSRVFLGDGVLKLGRRLESRFHKMPHKIGFTFACQREFGSSQVTLECEASSWRDKRRVWVQVTGTALLRQPLNAAKHEQAEALFYQGLQFLDNEVVPLLGDFDQADEEPHHGD